MAITDHTIVLNYPKTCNKATVQNLRFNVLSLEARVARLAKCSSYRVAHKARYFNPALARVARLSLRANYPVAHKARTNFCVMDKKLLALGLTEIPSCPVAHKARYHYRVNATQALLCICATVHFWRVPHRHSLHIRHRLTKKVN